MTGLTAILIASGKLTRLQESIASFLAQDCSCERQLIVLNTCIRQTLSGDFPNVTFVNAKQQIMPMRANNLSIQNAAHDGLMIWSELDYYLPNHLQRVYDNLSGKDWCWFDHELQSDNRKHMRMTHGSESVFAFTKSAWSKVGGFSHGINGADDRGFLTRVTKETHGEVVPTMKSETSFIRVGSDSERSALRPEVKSGVIKLNCVPQRDFGMQARDFKTGNRPTRICVVELGRYGDIINILPYLKMIADRYMVPHLCVSNEFASLLEGVSYVQPYPVQLKNEELGSALALCNEEFDIVINAQIWGKGVTIKKTEPAYNVQSWASCGVLNKFNDFSIRPVFDKRNREREAKLIQDVQGTDTRPMILVNVSKAVSSPCPHCAPLIDSINEKWNEYHVVDLSTIQAHRLYDMIGLMEEAVCLVSLDTSFLHLCSATNVPVVAILNPKEWAGTVVRSKNLAYVTNYDAVKEKPELVHDGIEAALAMSNTSVVEIEVEKSKPGSVYHLVDRFDDTDQNAIKRKAKAVESWDQLYENSSLIPIHVWDFPRNSKDTIGDTRRLPYLKDLLQKGIDGTQPGDVIIWSNDDTILHPKIVEYAKFHCSVYGACSFFRTEFYSQPPPTDLSVKHYARFGKGSHVGRDAFAFSREWLVQNMDEIPDFLLGACEFDLWLAIFIRHTFGIETNGENLDKSIFPAEPERGFCGHVAHKSIWNQGDSNASPSNRHNRKLFREYCAKHFPKLKFTPENTLQLA